MLVEEFLLRNLVFWCIFWYWSFLGLNFSGFGMNKTKLCYIYFTLNIKSSVGLGLLELGIWEVEHDVVSCVNFGESWVSYTNWDFV